MLFAAGLTTARILAVFQEEMGAHRGEITQTFDDNSRLYARAVLPQFADVLPGDRLRGGVAIKATQAGVWLYPYIFRVVCSNGAIVAQTIDERPVADPYRKPKAVLHTIREAVAACCKEEVFRRSLEEMRRTIATEGHDQLQAVLHMLSRLSVLGQQAEIMAQFIERSVPGSQASESSAAEADARAKEQVRSALRQSLSQLAGLPITPARPTGSAAHHGDLLPGVLSQYWRGGDQSQFGLANAITAVARDVQDPELKWDLEKLGGAVAIGTIETFRRAAVARVVQDLELKWALEKMGGAVGTGTIRRRTNDRRLAAEAEASLFDKELLSTA